jgi:gluconolactonase
MAVTALRFRGTKPMPNALTGECTRRAFLASSAGTAGILASLAANADPLSAQPVRYPDSRIVTLDPRFGRYSIGNTPVQRLYHNPGMLWAEGPAWNAVGKYLLWSDIPNDRQFRWIEDDERVTVFRKPAGNSNGNTFDFQGRQLACEHGHRRVVRYEHDGGITVLADRWNSKRLNAPNDVVVHPNGDIWFTDPGYGSMGNYEGHKGALEVKEAVYRIDAQDGQMNLVTDEVHKPNGLCFSPDYKKLYVADTGGPNPKQILVWNIEGEQKLANRKPFASMGYQGKNGGADGIRADTDGNIWAAAGWAGDGYDGAHVFAPDGQRIGLILLPEICANLCFGGEKRNRLFMVASQSLYAVYVEAQGAHIT